MITYNWQPWTVDGDRRILADESVWQQPIDWNSVAKRTGERGLVIVGPDVFRNFNDDAVFVYRRPDGVYERRPLRMHLFFLIDACPHLDFILTTSEPGRVRGMWRVALKDFLGSEVGIIRVRRNIILSAGPIRTQDDADRMVTELLKLRNLCGGLGVTVEPVERVDLHPWLKNGGGIHCSGCLPHKKHLDGATHQFQTIEHPGDGIDYLVLTGGIPEHRDSLAAQCRSAGCVMVHREAEQESKKDNQ